MVTAGFFHFKLKKKFFFRIKKIIKDPTVITKINYVQPFFGDHVLVEFIVDSKLNAVTENICRDWRNYSKDLLCDKLSNINWDIDVCDVQQFWNVFENLLIKVVDEIVPMTVFHGNVVKNNTPRIIKNKINKRNRLLKSFRKRPSLDTKNKITSLNCEIRSYFFYRKKLNVRKVIVCNTLILK